MLRFGLLGPLLVDVDGCPVELVGTRPKALLAILLAHANHVVGMDRLIDDLWAGTPTPGAAATLQGYVSELRKALAAATGASAPIVTRRPGYLIQLETDQLDVLGFQRLIDEARAATAAGKAEAPQLAAGRLREALALWRGPALADFADEPFSRPIATRLEEARMWALEERVEMDLRAGLQNDLVDELLDLTDRHPLRERLWGQRMLALYRCGRQAEALRSYQELRRHLDEELGIEPSPQLQRLELAVLSQDPALELAAPAVRPTPEVGPEPAPPDGLLGDHGHVVSGLGSASLPAQLTGFVGRKRELQAVRQLLAGTRLLTLTGTGGCGKTRLALQLAAEEAGRFTQGARFVDLSPVCEPSEVPAAVGAAFGLLGHADAEAVCDRLGDAEVLLVLDNCEHVIEPCAAMVEDLLSRCSGLTILATSQEELRILGETVWRVPSLGVPDDAGPPAAERILHAEAVQLFLERATSALPGFDPDDAALADIASICRRLDGIPLAIELAAALVSILRVDDIVRRLDDRFALLTRGGRRSVARQRTLRAAIDWSHDLLSPSERELFARLTVFVGSFTLEAAEVTCGRGGGFFDDFSALVSKSMVVALPGAGGVQRYRLLETLRHYGLERLQRMGAEPDARNRHAAYYTTFAEAADAHLHGSNATDWTNQVVRELPNLRVALDWSFSSGDLEVGVRLAGALRWWFFARMGQLEQARAWLERALERRKELPAELQLKALTASTTVAFSQGDYRWASEVGDEAVALAEELNDRADLAMALMARASAAVYEGNAERALDCLRRSLVYCQEQGDRWGKAFVLMFWGVLSRRSGDNDRARAQLEESLAIFRDLRDDHNQVVPLMQLALVAQKAGDLDEAARVSEEAVALARRLGDRQLTHGAICISGLTELGRGRHQEARRLLVTCLRSFRGAEHHLIVALAVEGLAVLAHREGRDSEAVLLWGYAGAVRTVAACPMTAEAMAERDGHLEQAGHRIGAGLVERELRRGAVLAFEDVLELVSSS